MTSHLKIFFFYTQLSYVYHTFISHNCTANSNRCSGSLDTASACCLNPCFSKKWATLVRCSFGIVGRTLIIIIKLYLYLAVPPVSFNLSSKYTYSLLFVVIYTLSAVSKSLLITAVWYSKTDSKS